MKKRLDRLPTLPQETRKIILGLIDSARDEAFWAEDTLGISGDSREKALIDELINRLREINKAEAKKAIIYPGWGVWPSLINQLSRNGRKHADQSK